MGRHVIGVALSVLVTPLPQQALAQVPGPRDSLVWAALARLQPGKGIRVHTSGLGRLEGSFASLTDSTVTLGTAPAARSVALAGIDSLWQRGSAAKTGAIAGAAVCVIPGALLGSLVGSGGFEGGETKGEEGAVVGGLAGAAACGLLGAVIGSAITKWHRRVP